MAEPEPSKSVKEFWQGTLSDNMDDLRNQLLEAAAAVKEVWMTCEHCRHKSRVEIADARARTDAVKALHALAGEMPKTDTAQAGGAGFVLKRVLVMPNGQTVELRSGDQLPGPDAA